jgi:beta-N-acetylhexosaminidase
VSMTARDLAGQMVQIQVPGQECTPETAAFLEKYRVGSVILFSGNVYEPAQAAKFTGGLQEAARKAGLPPLLIAIDQEGGGAQTVQQGVSHPPFMMGIGDAGDEAHAAAAGKVLARELRGMGFNWLFAPVLDVNCNPLNPVIGPRSFSGDPDVVARMGVAFFEAAEAEGVLACGKHFPGHGDTSRDSHLDLPFLGHDRERLHAVELKPFKAVMAAGIGSLMTAHVVFPALEPTGVPATLSHTVLTGLLREELGYDGLLVTDSMVMKAIDENYGIADAAVRAVLAGADMVMALGGLDRAAETVEALTAAIESGAIPRERAAEAVRRIQKAKERICREQEGWVRYGDTTVCDCDEHRALVDAACRVAVRPVTTAGMPRLAPAERVLVLAPEKVERPMAIDYSTPLPHLVTALRTLGVDAVGADTGMNPDDARVAELVREAAGAATVILCCTEKASLAPGLATLAGRLSKEQVRLIMVSLGGPYAVETYPNAVCAYGRFEPSCRALAAALVQP